MDASVSVGFVKLRHMCAGIDADLVLTALPARSRDLLAKTGTLSLRIHELATLDAGLERVEDRLAAEESDALPPSEANCDALFAAPFTAQALDTLIARLAA